MGKYDYLIVGAGLFGAVFGRRMRESGRKVLLIDKRKQIGGNVFTDERSGITVHVFGAHLFHTSSKKIWDYVRGFAEFNHYQHHVKAKFGDQLFSLPFNMHTFQQLWGVLCLRLVTFYRGRNRLCYK